VTPARLRACIRDARLIAGVFVCAAALQGCVLVVPQTEALRESWPGTLPAQAELDEVPFFPQEDYWCGPSSLAATLAYAGAGVTPDGVAKEVYLPGRRGSLQVEMEAAPRRHGFVSYRLAPTYEAVLREVAAGNPVIVLQDYGVWPISYWHYAVVIGFDRVRGEVVLRSGRKRRLVMPLAVLEYTWKESAYWALVTPRPSRVPATAEEGAYVRAVAAMARVGDAEAAITAYGAALQRWPGSIGASLGLGNAHYARHDLARAEAVLRAALERHPESPALLNNLAQVVSDAGRHSEALELIVRAQAVGGELLPAILETRAAIVERAAPPR
jgi:hypothetical protein